MQRKLTAAVTLILIIFLAACALRGPGPNPSDLSQEDQVNTAAAKTVAALGTLIAEGKNPTLGVSQPPTAATATPSPTGISLPATAAATEAPGAATQAAATATPGDGTPVNADAPCNRASFVRDVTYLDGSVVLPNSPFTKIWELKNTGSCSWKPDYSVVFAGQGESMGGPASSSVVSEGEVKPGESAMVSVTLRAPGEPGSYKGYWMLRGGDGKTFGTGPNAAAPFYVDIRVDNQFSFAEHICSAKWSTAAGDLPCPGSESDTQGFVTPLENPTLENNEQREGPGILVAPQPVPGGVIVARYPAVVVPTESDFRAVIGCQRGWDGCYVRFKVTYQVDNGPEELLGEWNEGYEGGITNAIRDLDMVAGRLVAFNLYVTVAGTPDRSRAIWFNPRITK